MSGAPKTSASQQVAVDPLAVDSPWVAEIARGQFDYWGELTGHPSAEAYEAALRGAAAGVDPLPRVLVASRAGVLLGSVNVMRSEMTIRPALTPWMGQLFVAEAGRGAGVGTRLAEGAVAYAAFLGFPYLHLFTSGTLPAYYRARGWEDVEEVDYLGKRRTVMRLALRPAPGRASL